MSPSAQTNMMCTVLLVLGFFSLSSFCKPKKAVDETLSSCSAKVFAIDSPLKGLRVFNRLGSQRSVYEMWIYNQGDNFRVEQVSKHLFFLNQRINEHVHLDLDD